MNLLIKKKKCIYGIGHNIGLSMQNCHIKSKTLFTENNRTFVMP